MSAGARGDRAQAADGLARRGGRRGAWGGRSGVCAGPGPSFPPRLLVPTLTTAFGGGVCESQGLGGRHGQRGAVDAQIPLGLA